MANNPRVVVVGSYVQDLTWRCAAFPSAGQTIIGTFAEGMGGKGSNQAVASALAGASVRFVAAVGRDTFARTAKEFYRENKIAARWIEKPGHATGTAGILVNAEGQNEIVVALGANAKLSAKDLPASLFKGAKLVVTQFETNPTAVAHTLRAGRAAGAITVFNPAPMRADFKPSVLKHVDVLIPNETEFTELVNLLPATGRTDFTETELGALGVEAGGELQTLCRALGVPVVIVTLGRRGCFVSTDAGGVLVPAFKVKAVDTTGAGDAFVGGFCAGWQHFDGDLAQAALFGNAVAALSVTKHGTAKAMPTLTAVKRFLKQAAR